MLQHFKGSILFTVVALTLAGLDGWWQGGRAGSRRLVGLSSRRFWASWRHRLASITPSSTRPFCAIWTKNGSSVS